MKYPGSYSRRHFLRQVAGAGALAATGLHSLLGQTPPPPGPEKFRFAFVTDIHLLKNGALRSDIGLATCLAAVEKLDPKPDFILVGGDLVNLERDMTIPEAEKGLDAFLSIWHDNTGLPAHWVFGNHDLAGTSNKTVSPDDKYYATKLFQDRFQLPSLSYSFDWKGWHFTVLDDINLLPDHHYNGKVTDQDLQFLRDDLAAHSHMPTIVSTHIPLMSAMPLGLFIEQAMSNSPNARPTLANLVCTNANGVIERFQDHNVRAVLCGHLHHQEKIDMHGIHFINGGAVCGNYWKGPMLDSHEGFGVVDVGEDGSVTFDYRGFGWKPA